MVLPWKPKRIGVIWVTGGHVDRSGLSRYTHLIRSSEDFDRTPREFRKGKETAWRKDLHPGTIIQWRHDILRVLAGGSSKTFNQIVLEITGGQYTADNAFEKAPDMALWDLVEERKLSHTLQAPILFRRTK